MGKFKLNKKHLFYFPVMLLLLFSLNLNTFASTKVVYHLADIMVMYVSSDGIYYSEVIDYDVASGTHSINDVSYNSTTFVFPVLQQDDHTDDYRLVSFFDSDLTLYTNTSYRYHFWSRIGANDSENTKIEMSINYIVNGEHHSSQDICVIEPTNGWYEVSGVFTTPDLTGSAEYLLFFDIYDFNSGPNTYANRWTVTDIVFTVDDPLIMGTPITTPSTEELENTLNDYYDVMDSLPQVDENEFSDLMEFDFDSFTDGMSFVREMFERTMNTFGFNAVLVFALTVGLATYIIGRKVG